LCHCEGDLLADLPDVQDFGRRDKFFGRREPEAIRQAGVTDCFAEFTLSAM